MNKVFDYKTEFLFLLIDDSYKKGNASETVGTLPFYFPQLFNKNNFLNLLKLHLIHFHHMRQTE